MSLKEHAREEAAEWFARRRRGVMTLRERADYEAWLRVPANSAAIGEMERLWQLLAGLQPSVMPGPELKEVQPLRVRRSALVAILCVAGLGVGMISYAGHSDFWTRLDWVER